jgi:hypothetical protein
MTFAELEAAFFSGLINADTSVLDAGATEWRTLRQIAGRDTVEAPAGGDSIDSPQIAGSDAVESPAPSGEDVDTDYELKLVDFRAGQRRVLALAAAGAFVMVIAIACALSFERRSPSLPTPWIGAAAGSIDSAPASLPALEASAEGHQPDKKGQITPVRDVHSPSVKVDRPASRPPVPVGVTPAAGHRARDKLFHP